MVRDLCPVCLMGGEEVVGDPDDFAHRCPKHMPAEDGGKLFMSLRQLREYEAALTAGGKVEEER